MKYRSQKGVALITILLVVVIATILGVSMSTEQNFAINRARSFFDQGIVRQYAYGGEELARQILHQDYIEQPGIDHRSENWASREMKFDFEEGEVELLIEDLQSKLNLNGLRGSSLEITRARFSNLLAQQGIDQVYVDRIIDWIDEDNSTRPLGAEDFEYLGLDRPYRTSGQLMLDISELRLILEMDSETFAAIAPYITALPHTDVPININTATAPVLQTIATGLSLEEAMSIVAYRDENQPYASVSNFTGDPSIPNSSRIKADSLSVQSNFFQVSIRARYQDRFGYLTSIIQRDPTDGSMRVIYRNQGKKIAPLVGNELSGQGADNG